MESPPLSPPVPSVAAPSCGSCEGHEVVMRVHGASNADSEPQPRGGAKGVDGAARGPFAPSCGKRRRPKRGGEGTLLRATAEEFVPGKAAAIGTDAVGKGVAVVQGQSWADEAREKPRSRARGRRRSGRGKDKARMMEDAKGGPGGGPGDGPKGRPRDGPRDGASRQRDRRRTGRSRRKKGKASDSHDIRRRTVEPPFTASAAQNDAVKERARQALAMARAGRESAAAQEERVLAQQKEEEKKRADREFPSLPGDGARAVAKPSGLEWRPGASQERPPRQEEEAVAVAEMPAQAPELGRWQGPEIGVRPRVTSGRKARWRERWWGLLMDRTQEEGERLRMAQEDKEAHRVTNSLAATSPGGAVKRAAGWEEEGAAGGGAVEGPRMAGDGLGAGEASGGQGSIGRDRVWHTVLAPAPYSSAAAGRGSGFPSTSGSSGSEDESPDTPTHTATVAELHELIRTAKGHRTPLLPQLVRLLENGADWDGRLGEGRLNAFHLAATIGRADMLQVLLSHAPLGVDCRDKRRLLPLHHAANGGHLECTELLLEAGTAVERKDRASETALHKAAKNGHTDVAQLLTRFGAKPTTKNKRGQSPLHYAVGSGSVATVSCLLDAGAIPDSRDVCGCTPLSLAASLGFADILGLLLHRNTPGSWADDAVDRHGTKGLQQPVAQSAIHEASLHGQVNCIEVLVDALGNGVLERPNPMPSFRTVDPREEQGHDPSHGQDPYGPHESHSVPCISWSKAGQGDCFWLHAARRSCSTGGRGRCQHLATCALPCDQCDSRRGSRLSPAHSCPPPRG